MSRASRYSGEPDRSVHRPVLLREIVRFLDLQPGLIVVDATVGAGGHSREILQHLGQRGTLIGLDRDPMMVQLASSVLSSANCHLRISSYAKLPAVLEELGIQHVDRILLDLGFSSDQLQDESRGFNFQSEAPLDLRFDPSHGRPAWELIDQLSEQELSDILRDFGEERHSARIARRLVQLRTTTPVRTAKDLAEAVKRCVAPGQTRSTRQPATRVFQALRIAVNDELDHLKTALQSSFHDRLAERGRIVVVTFHSLEDRLVKQEFRRKERWQNLTPKPVTASAVEKRINPRCRTAKLRAAKKV